MGKKKVNPFLVSSIASQVLKAREIVSKYFHRFIAYSFGEFKN